MRFSRTMIYAARALAYLAAHQGTGRARTEDMARECGIPPRFAVKILLNLAQAGMLHSQRGLHGGYRLARSPKEITLLEVIEAAEGPLPAGLAPGLTAGNVDARLEQVARDAAELVRKRLAKVRLTDLAAPAQKEP